VNTPYLPQNPGHIIRKRILNSLSCLTVNLCLAQKLGKATHLIAPLPINEHDRLDALHGYEILDTEPEESFDDITALASQICDTPMASITLIDEKRQWFKSKIGLTVSETPRDLAFCAHTILQKDLLVVEDAKTDERFASNPMVTGDPKVRFYAGSPLTMSDGHALGTICVLDRVPRQLTEEQKTALQLLSRQVVTQLELRHSLKAKSRGEDQLRTSELNYRRLFEAAKDGILILDVGTGRITDVNPFLFNLLGFTRDEMIGQTVGELSPFKDIESNQLMLERLQQDGYVRYEDLPLETRDGRHLEVEFVCNIYPVGNTNVIQCNIRDITERKKAEQRMALLDTCISNLNDIVLITDAELTHGSGPKILFANEAFERITGYTAAEVLGKSPRFLQGEKTDRRVMAEIGRAVVKQQPIRRQIINYGKNGTEYWLEIDIVPIFNAAGKCTYFAAIEREITEQKRAEIVATRLASIVESSDDAIIGKDLNGIITSWNAGAKRIFGYTSDEMIGTSIMQLIPADRQAEENQILTKIKHGESVEHFETLRQAKDGRLIPVSVTASPIRNTGGEVVGISKVARDITERLESEEALRKSEERFRSYFELGQIGMAITSSTKGCLEVNDKMCQILGYERSELLHKTWAEMTHPDDLAADVANFNHVLAGDFDGYSTNKRFVRKDGQVVDSTITVKCLRREDGSIDYFVAMLQDITEQHRMEQALRENERKFRALFEDANDAIYLMHDGLFSDCNAKGLEYFGVKREEIIGRRPADFSPAHQADGRDSMEKATEFIQSALAGKPQFFEWINQRPDGTPVCSDVSLSRFEVGDNAYLQAIARDITERKKSEEQIVEQAALLDNARDSILVCDLDGKILFWNKGSERMYGWTSQEVLDRNIAGLLYPNPKTFEEIKETTNAQGEWHGELQKLAKDRHEITVEVQWTLIRNKKGEPKSMLSINTDITERKKIEAQFMRAQRMESIGTLAGGIAHDLNNILAPIMMSIDILKTLSENPQATKILETIEVSAQRGADIVRQVLSFARGVEGERVEVQPKHLLQDLGSIIKDTFPKDIRLQFSIPNDTWTILGDPTQVHQILLNLCVNARDAMPNGGSLTLSVENWVVDKQYAAMHVEAMAGRYVSINVTDSGMGMTQGTINKIFEPFFTTKELTKGTGLGLSTVMAIVKSHNGFINVYSELGKGTTFIVYLPAMEISSEAGEEQSVELSLPRGKGETVLLVDDEASVVIITSQTLEAFGYKVLSATDGADALGVYLKHQNEIAVVLTDMMMPIMDGPAMIHALMRINPGIKIIAASGLKANDSVAKASGVGLKHFLAKPYTAGTLLKTMRKILDEV